MGDFAWSFGMFTRLFVYCLIFVYAGSYLIAESYFTNSHTGEQTQPVGGGGKPYFALGDRGALLSVVFVHR